MKTYKIPEDAIKEFSGSKETIEEFQKMIDKFYNAVDPVLQKIKKLPKEDQTIAIYQIFSSAPSEPDRIIASLVIGQEIGHEVTQDALVMHKISTIFNF